jgi:hypothetical protein
MYNPYFGSCFFQPYPCFPQPTCYDQEDNYSTCTHTYFLGQSTDEIFIPQSLFQDTYEQTVDFNEFQDECDVYNLDNTFNPRNDGYYNISVYIPVKLQVLHQGQLSATIQLITASGSVKGVASALATGPTNFNTSLCIYGKYLLSKCDSVFVKIIVSGNGDGNFFILPAKRSFTGYSC